MRLVGIFTSTLERDRLPSLVWVTTMIGAMTPNHACERTGSRAGLFCSFVFITLFLSFCYDRVFQEPVAPLFRST
jgi:hypothetical protein